MAKIMHLIGGAVVASALAGCATPRYETIRHYQAPETPAGQACIQRCEQVRASCKSTCQVAWQACTARVESQVEDRYAQALKDYASDLARYRRALDLYQMDLWMNWRRPYGGLWYEPWPYQPWHSFAFAPTPPDAPPSRESVRQSLYKAECKDDCACEVNYDTCFTGCGGTLRIEQRRLDAASP